MQTVDLARLDPQPGDLVLDLGCGEGRHLRGLIERPGVFALGLDLAIDDLRRARDSMAGCEENPAARLGAAGDKKFTARWGVAGGDALALPLADHSVDHVICAEVLEHLPDYRAALAEIKRVLKPGGSFVASVPRYGPERMCWALSHGYHQAKGGHVRIFRTGRLRRDIERLGLRCWARHWAHALHSPYWWLQCLLWKSREKSVIIKTYHQFLVWDMMQKPALTRLLDRFLNPLIGKSVVIYFRNAA
ncbi:MAG: class I SAM-dependent methyltransferase [Alphaproteobacteria bacterium]